MNGQRHDVKTNNKKPVANHANNHNLDFSSYFTTRAIKFLPKEKLQQLFV